MDPSATSRKLVIGGVVGGVCLVVSTVIVLGLLLCRDRWRKARPASFSSSRGEQSRFGDGGGGPGWHSADRPRSQGWDARDARRGSDWRVSPPRRGRFWRGSQGDWQVAPYTDRGGGRLPRSSVGDWEVSPSRKTSHSSSRGDVQSTTQPRDPYRDHRGDVPVGPVMPRDPYSRVIRPLHDVNTPFSDSDRSSTSTRFADRYQSHSLGGGTGSVAVVPFRESRLPIASMSYTREGRVPVPCDDDTFSRGESRISDDVTVHRSAEESRRRSRDDASSDVHREDVRVHREDVRIHREEPASRFIGAHQPRYARSNSAGQQRHLSRDAPKRIGVTPVRRGSSEQLTRAKLTKPEDLHWPSSNFTHDSGFHELHDDESPDEKLAMHLPRLKNVYLNQPDDSFM